MISDFDDDPGATKQPERESAFAVLERDHSRRIRRNWLILLVIPPLGGILLTVLLLLLPPVYEAVGAVRLTHGLDGPRSSGRIGLSDFGDEVALLSTQQFKQRVALELPPDIRQELALRYRGSADPHETRGGSWRHLSTVLSSGVRITSDPDTALLRISDENGDPELAAELVNATIRAARQAGTEAAIARGQTVQAFFEPKLASLKDLIRREQETEDKLGQVSAEESATQPGVHHGSQPTTGVPARQARSVRKDGIDPREAITFAKPPSETSLEEVERAAARAKLEERLELARLKLRKSEKAGDAGSLDPAYGDAVLDELQDSLTETSLTRSQLSETLGESNPRMKALAARTAALELEIAHLRQFYLRDAERQLERMRRQSAALDQEAETERSRLAALLRVQQTSAVLEADLSVNLTLLADLEQKLRAYPVDAGLEAPLLDVVEFAQVPAQPIGFSYAQSFILGGMAGTLLALLLLAWVEVRSRRRWSVFGLENAAGRPVLALFKQSATDRQDHAAADFGESLRDLRSALGLMRGAKQSMTILFTSSRVGEGTTTILSALALLLAKSGERVLLLDANPYRPRLHHQLGLSARTGLSQLLTGGVRLQHAVQTVPVTSTGRLDVITAGPPAPIPSDLLQSFAFDAMLREAGNAYSFVLLDCAPAGAPVGLPGMAQVDAVMLIARFNAVELRQVRYTERHLKAARAPLRAVLVNGVPQGRLEINGSEKN